MRINLKYFFLTLLLFITEVLIALFVNDSFIRPYVGDYLVVMLMYCAARSIADTDITYTAIGVLLFSYLIEIMQYFRIVEIFGLEKYKVARIVIGTSFEWIDLVAYTLGIITVLIIERGTQK